VLTLLIHCSSLLLQRIIAMMICNAIDAARVTGTSGSARETCPNRKVCCKSEHFYDLSLMGGSRRLLRSGRNRGKFHGRRTQACRLDQAEPESGIPPGLAQSEGNVLQPDLNRFQVKIETRGKQDLYGGGHKRHCIGCVCSEGTTTLGGGRSDIHAGSRKVNP